MSGYKKKLLVTILALVTTMTNAAVAMYIKIPDIDGESKTTDEHGEFWFEGLRPGVFTPTMPKPCLSKPGSGGGGKRCMDDTFAFTKRMDSFSPGLFLHAKSGRALCLVEVCFTEAEVSDSLNTADCYIKIKLDRVFVKSWSTGSAEAPDSIPVEMVALSFERKQMVWQKTIGDRKKMISECWDNKKGMECEDITTYEECKKELPATDTKHKRAFRSGD